MRTLLHAVPALAVALAACGPARLPPPPAEPAAEMTLDVERIRRGAAPVTVVTDTERDEGRVRAAVLQRRADIQECIERVLPANPELAGRIDLAFVVETSGLVHDATGDTTVQALRAPKECVLAIVRETRVDGLRRAAAVRFPIEYENPPVELTLSEVAIFPRMRTDPPTSAAVAVRAGTGDLGSDEAQAVLDGHLADYLACYAPLVRGPFRRGQPRPQGSARFELNVTPTGEVSTVTRNETSDPVPQAAECLQGVLQGLRFRATGRRALVRTRFAMRPQEAPATPALAP